MSFIASQYQPSGGGGRPSFFEVIAQDRMIPGLKMASRYILTVFAQRYFGILKVLKYHDELFLALQMIVDNHFLDNYDATFSEHLYGLMRVGLVENNQISKITKHQKIISLILSTLVPYLKSRIDTLYQDMTRGEVPQRQYTLRSSQNSNLDRIVSSIKSLFLKIWPYCNAAYEGLFFLYMVLYLFKDAPFFSPLLHLQRIILQRVTTTDAIMQRRDMLIRRLKTIYKLRARGTLWRVLEYVLRIGYTISDYSTYVLLGIAFLFKFFEWWYASENQLKGQITVVIPPPPRPPVKADRGIELPQDITLCPLCSKTRVNPTLLSVSGHAYCYSCIHQYVSTHHKCPYTRIPATLDHLRRVYEQA
jgi:peroxin-12